MIMEKKAPQEELRIGVYICHCGGNISEVVDVEKVAKEAGVPGDVVVSRDYGHMCSDVGQKLIADDIKEYELDRVVVAACSPQFQGGTFMRVSTLLMIVGPPQSPLVVGNGGRYRASPLLPSMEFISADSSPQM